MRTRVEASSMSMPVGGFLCLWRPTSAWPARVPARRTLESRTVGRLAHFGPAQPRQQLLPKRSLFRFPPRTFFGRQTAASMFLSGLACLVGCTLGIGENAAAAIELLLEESSSELLDQAAEQMRRQRTSVLRKFDETRCRVLARTSRQRVPPRVFQNARASLCCRRFEAGETDPRAVPEEPARISIGAVAQFALRRLSRGVQLSRR